MYFFNIKVFFKLISLFINMNAIMGEHGSMVAGLIPIEITGYFNWPNTSSHTMAQKSSQPLTEMSTRNLPGVRSDNITTNWELTLCTMWEP
jgi:hypothetical protein